ncbi:MAG: phosphoglycerate dehydrogenase related dehydrogenase [uncultured archaeon A07HB70]|nr:MAG: phosphoglycerate dehydrogenase related dehydrogenase [uncultured archaeon A07HB70]
MGRVDVGVFQNKSHGLSVDDYVAALERRLPDHEVEVGRTTAQKRDLAREATVVSAGDISPQRIASDSNLELFAGIAAGYEHLPLDTLTQNGVVVTNASGVHAPNAAEQVLAYILAFSRNLRRGWERQRRREWRHYQAGELKGSTVTIVGLGAIGTAIAQRVSAFDVHTIGVRYSPDKGGPTDRVIGFDDDAFRDVLIETEYLCIASPLTETTQQLVSADELEALPPDAFLINVGRGPIVDTDALTTAVQKNRIGGAALDVTDPEPLPVDHPLWRLGSVTITPHNAGHSPQHWSRLADILATNIERLERGTDISELQNVVARPSC